ncbi:MAG: serine--tRNA ligase [Armatimonadota bacterium]|nr:serine--tRNA ligase [Armatimonadota bacterium]
MLDIKLLREKPEFVKERLQARSADPAAIDAVLSADARWREVKSEAEELQARLKNATREIAKVLRETGNINDETVEEYKARIKDENRALGDRIAALNEQVRVLVDEREDLLYYIPNLPHADTPEGGEENNVVVRSVGEPRAFGFAPKAHWDLATDLELIDFTRGAKLAGSGFALYKGLGALLERGLIQFMLDLHLTKHGYTEFSTPFFLLRESMKASGHLAKFTPEMYHDAEDDLFALPTAEPALVNIHREELLDGRDLPLKYVAYSPCWRREAGAAGKDTRGLLRVHQFDKVEMVQYTLPEASYDALESMLTDATDVLDTLGLPYRIKLLAGGDISFASAKTYDIETYAPGVGAWLEVSSCSNCEDFQSRQANVRFRREPGSKPEFAHLLNGSGLALPRIVATLLETYQRADGGIDIPPALQPYLGGRTELVKG